METTDHLQSINKLPFNLRKGEHIIKEIKPVPQLLNYFKYGYFVFFGFVLLVTVVGIFFIPFVYFIAIWAAQKSYEQRMYWITNKRVVYKRGFLGYRITSIPFNRISDIIISRTWFENYCGFSSLHIETLAGQVSSGGSGIASAEAALAGVVDPEGLQELILDYVEKASISGASIV